MDRYEVKHRSPGLVHYGVVPKKLRAVPEHHSAVP